MMSNSLPDLLAEFGQLVSEYATISDTFDEEVKQTQIKFKQKYRECVQEEIKRLDEEEQPETNIQSFASQISSLKLFGNQNS